MYDMNDWATIQELMDYFKLSRVTVWRIREKLWRIYTRLQARGEVIESPFLREHEHRGKLTRIDAFGEVYLKGTWKGVSA